MTQNKKKLFKKEYAKELLRIAKGDLESAKLLSKHISSGRPENIVFLAQQAAEKAIKAVLIHLQISFPLVHDMGILIALLPQDKMPPGGFALTELNPYASIRRYEEGPLPLSKDEIEVSLQASEDVAVWAEEIIS